MAPLCSPLRVDLAPPPPPITPPRAHSLPFLQSHLPIPAPPHPRAPIRQGSCARAASLCLPASLKINIRLRRLQRHVLWIKQCIFANERQFPPIIFVLVVCLYVDPVKKKMLLVSQNGKILFIFNVFFFMFLVDEEAQVLLRRIMFLVCLSSSPHQLMWSKGLSDIAPTAPQASTRLTTQPLFLMTPSLFLLASSMELKKFYSGVEA